MKRTKELADYIFRTSIDNMDFDYVEFLLQKGADPNAYVSGESLSTLTVQIKDFNLNYIKLVESEKIIHLLGLLKQHGANFQLANRYGRNPLFYSVTYDTTDITKYLLENGLDPNSKDFDGSTPAFHAYTADQIQELYNYGADLNIVNKNYETALSKSLSNMSEMGLRKTVKLLELGANNDIKVVPKKGGYKLVSKEYLSKKDDLLR